MTLLAFLLLAVQAPNASRDERIKPERLGLPAGNVRTSEPFVTRIYKTKDDGEFLRPQPKGYPFTIERDYELQENEAARVHEGIDLSSRRGPGQVPPAMLDFKAGVYGIVKKAGDGPWGTITVQLQDGSLLQYLHTSASHVKKDDLVTPDTLLGVTGQTGAGAIHLHIQAKDRNGNAISPDLAFKAGQRRLETKAKPDPPDADALEFDPSNGPKPKAIGRKVAGKHQPESKWVVEVIGEAGRVDEVLGEFATYQSAVYCARQWIESRTSDLRLTR